MAYLFGARDYTFLSLVSRPLRRNTACQWHIYSALATIPSSHSYRGPFAAILPANGISIRDSRLYLPLTRIEAPSPQYCLPMAYLFETRDYTFLSLVSRPLRRNTACQWHIYS